MGSFMQVYTDGGGIREARVPDDYMGKGSQAFLEQFIGFKKCLLASLVASSTASRTSNIVTITATAHGVPTGATYIGFRFFYPGSAGLAAGWYDSITDVQTNTISFNAPGADFGSQSVNSAAAYTTQTVIPGFAMVPANYLNESAVVRIATNVGGGTTAATKTWRPAINGNLLSGVGGTTSPFSVREALLTITTPTTLGMMVVGGNLNGIISGAFDRTTENLITVALTVSAAADFMVCFNAPMIQLM